MELKGKRLLYIGGSASITDIAFYTKSHGIKLLVAGKSIPQDIQALTDEENSVRTCC